MENVMIDGMFFLTSIASLTMDSSFENPSYSLSSSSGGSLFSQSNHKRNKDDKSSKKEASSKKTSVVSTSSTKSSKDICSECKKQRLDKYEDPVIFKGLVLASIFFFPFGLFCWLTRKKHQKIKCKGCGHVVRNSRAIKKRKYIILSIVLILGALIYQAAILYGIMLYLYFGTNLLLQPS